MTKKILIFSGSLRKDAYTKQLGKIIERICDEIHALPTYVELNDYPLPLLNQDEVKIGKFPENVMKFREQLSQNDMWVIVTPEYNGSIPAVLKNVLDWTSRPASSEDSMNSLYKMRPILIISASPGPFGGIRAGNHLRQILCAMGAQVFPTAKPFMSIASLLGEDGSFKESKYRESLQELIKQFTM
ncbi:MAG: NAD(P)H-dependent oxidoreductase [Rhabdochlamydiaceae bacterium]|nr:NAD(P)H-dependent oxidoreductase [Candidatus Amphrikana amoebophyrae]